jgi:hypothetical protein
MPKTSVKNPHSLEFRRVIKPSLRSIDFVTGLPESEGYTNIMVITDRLSKGVILEPMESIDALYVAKKFISIFYRYHGIPTAIVSDRGTQFVSMFWAHFCHNTKTLNSLCRGWNFVDHNCEIVDIGPFFLRLRYLIAPVLVGRVA